MLPISELCSSGVFQALVLCRLRLVAVCSSVVFLMAAGSAAVAQQQYVGLGPSKVIPSTPYALQRRGYLPARDCPTIYAGPKCLPCKDTEFSGRDLSKLSASPKPLAPAPKPVRLPKKKAVVKRKVHVAKKPPVPHVVHSFPKRKPLVAHVHVTVAKSGAVMTPCAEYLAHLQSLIDSGRRDDADKLVKDELEKNPNDACIRMAFINYEMCRAHAAILCLDFECAARRLREVLFIDPQNQQAALMLTDTYQKSGVDPFDPLQRIAVAKALAAQGRYAGAFVEYMQSFALKPTLESRLGIAEMALKVNRKPLALSQLRYIVSRDPYNSTALSDLAFLSQDAGDNATAKAAFQRMLLMNPQDAIASEGLQNILRQSEAQNPSTAQAWLDMARSNLIAGNSAQAVQDFAKAQSLAPSGITADQWIAQQQSEIAQANSQLLNQKTAFESSTALTDFDNEGPVPSRPSDFNGKPGDLAALSSCSCH